MGALIELASPGQCDIFWSMRRITCCARRVYRPVLRGGSQVFVLLVVLLEYVILQKKSGQGSLESKEKLAVRQSSLVMDSGLQSNTRDFCSLPGAEVVVHTQIQWGLPPSGIGRPPQTAAMPLSTSPLYWAFRLRSWSPVKV